MKLIYSNTARLALKSFSPSLKPGLKAAVESLVDNPYGGKAMQKELIGFRSLAYKRYRILYEIESETDEIRIHLIQHRADIYQEAYQAINQLKKRRE